MNTFSIGEAINFGWEKMKKHFWFFVGILILSWIIQIVPTGIADIFKEKMPFVYTLLIIGVWVIQLIVNIGMIKITLNILDKDEANFNTLFSEVNLLGKFILSSLLYMLIVLGGLILFIVPGIIWAIKYQFFSYLIIDKNLAPLDAIKKSGEITSGNKGKIFWLGILLGLINMAGAICLFVGLFATIPTAMVAMAYVYRKLIGEMKTPEPVQLPINPVPVA